MGNSDIVVSCLSVAQDWKRWELKEYPERLSWLSFSYFYWNTQKAWSWGSVVGGVTRSQVNREIVGQVSAAGIDFSLLQNVQTGAGAHQAFSSMEACGAFLGVKRLGRETDHGPPYGVGI